MRAPHADPAQAHTPDPRLYGDPAVYASIVDRVFPNAWHSIGHVRDYPARAHPLMLLPGALDEPLLLTRPGTERRLMSNVCTHRGMLVCQSPCDKPTLRCGYHGRTFALDGRFKAMPEFQGVADFPSAKDDLPAAALHTWRGFLLGSIAPTASATELFAELDPYVAFLPVEDGEFDPISERTYDIEANWALYADNYLEGFHVPYVHPGLAQVLDYSKYRTATHRWGVLQTGIAGQDDACFDLPADHPDAGERVAGYYYWLFPTTMLNFYPWGISVNVIQPCGPTQTRVRYRAWVWDASKREGGAGAGLDAVELEDDAVVEATQLGVRSRLYRGGRYSPKRERGPHHFHRLLAEALAPSEG